MQEHLIKEGDFSNQTPFKMRPDDKQISLVVGPKGMGCRYGPQNVKLLFNLLVNKQDKRGTQDVCMD